MKNKTKMWRREGVQRSFRRAAVAAAIAMAERVTDPKAKRSFLERAERLTTCRVGRLALEHFRSMPKLR